MLLAPMSEPMETSPMTVAFARSIRSWFFHPSSFFCSRFISRCSWFVSLSRTDYTEEELEYVDVSVGSYTGVSPAEAENLAKADGFTVTVKGEGDTVLSQIPPASSSAPNGANIVLYTDNESKKDTVTVPDLSIGYTVSEVNSVASSYGLNVSLVGASSSGGVASSAQDIPPGTEVPEGTVISVTFVSTASVNE